MRCLNYRNNQLWMDDLPLSQIAAQWQTPTYVYSAHEIIRNIRAYQQGLAPHPFRLCFAVKANSNLRILQLIAEQGCGFEVVSGGELERVIRATGKPETVIFSGVGKSVAEITRAIEVGIFCFTVESANELERIQAIATQLNKVAPIALRINPDIDSKSHPNISTGKAGHKFGMSIEQAVSLLDVIKQSACVNLNGIACHIGSQITDISTFLPAMDKMLSLINQCQRQGFAMSFVNMGGGLGINYKSSDSPLIGPYTAQFTHALKNSPLMLILEPGRSLVGNAGILLSKVEYLKATTEKKFIILDAAMNDLMRPALYDGWHDIWPVIQHEKELSIRADVVGPVCETTDVLGIDRDLAVKEGDLVALLNTGAYGFSMSSNYNSRPRIAEVLVEGDQAHLIRHRENYAKLFADEVEFIKKEL